MKKIHNHWHQCRSKAQFGKLTATTLKEITCKRCIKWALNNIIGAEIKAKSQGKVLVLNDDQRTFIDDQNTTTVK